MTATRKAQFILDLDLPEGVTDAKIKRVIDEALSEAAVEAVIEKQLHANFGHKIKTFKEDPRIKTQAATIEEQDNQLLVMSAKMDELVNALEQLKAGPNSATTVNTIQVINAIIHAINNEPVNIPSSSYSKTEYFKAGCREQRRAANEAIRNIGAALVAGIPVASDAELFAYWVQEACLRPMRIMKALSGVDSIDAIREALTAMRNEDLKSYQEGTGQQINTLGILQ